MFSVTVFCCVVNVTLLDGMNSCCRIIESDGCQCPLVTTNTISRDEVQTGVSTHVGGILESNRMTHRKCELSFDWRLTETRDWIL